MEPYYGQYDSPGEYSAFISAGIILEIRKKEHILAPRSQTIPNFWLPPTTYLLRKATARDDQASQKTLRRHLCFSSAPDEFW